MANQLQEVFDFPTPATMAREDYIVSACNHAAAKWIARWPDWPMPVSLLIGPRGAGKTHLLSIWADLARADTITANDLASMDIDDLIGASPALAIDDLQLIEKSLADQEALFHLYNAAMDHSTDVLIASDRPVNQLNLALDDLASRLKAAPSVKIDPPDDDLLEPLLMKMFADRQLIVPKRVVDYLIKRMERSFHAAQNWVEKLDKAALSEQRRITLPLAREVLVENTSK
jgi:DnaA regulatory inactivator Hda